MKKKWKLASLLPGFLSVNAMDTVAEPPIEPHEGWLDGVILAPLNESTPLYIAGHRSHSSHSSHSSHRSSSGSSSRSFPSPTPAPSYQPLPKADPLGRPSTPAYTTPRESATPASKNGFDRETLIMQVQVSLRIFGYYNDAIDGKMGSNTRAAIKKYRQHRGLPETELIDATLLNSLGISAR